MPHEEEFVLFLDEGLHRCKPIVDLLARLGVRYERHCDHFARGTADSVWLPFVGDKRWAVLTTDKRMRYNDLEKTLIKTYRIRQFTFTSGNRSGQDMADILVKALPKMKRIFRRTVPPFIAMLTDAGNAHVRWQGE